jgi:hypothetical protein
MNEVFSFDEGDIFALVQLPSLARAGGAEKQNQV